MKTFGISLAVAGATLGVFLTSCSSVTPTYYTLDMTRSALPAAAVNIEPATVTVSETLAGGRLMIKKQPTVVEYYASSEWAAGLEELIAQKLEVEWGAPVAGRKTFAADVTALSFEQIDNATGADAFARLDVRLRAEGTSRYAEPVLEKVYECRKAAASASSADVVLALDDCLETIAAQIAADAAAL